MIPGAVSVIQDEEGNTFAFAYTPRQRIIIPLPDDYNPEDDNGREVLLRVAACIFVLPK
jgi:hypothetical protein